MEQKLNFIVFLILFSKKKLQGNTLWKALRLCNIIRHHIKLKFEHMDINTASVLIL